MNSETRGNLLSFLGQMPLDQLEFFCGRMGTGLRSGVSILKLFATEAKRGTTKHRQAMSSIRTSLQAGESLAEAFRAVDPYFPALLIQMVAAGETAGGLDRILSHMSQYYHALRMARRNFLGQIAWPLIQLGIAIGVICLVIALRGMVQSAPGEVEFDPLGFGLSGGSGVLVFLGFVLAVGVMLTIVSVGIWKNFFQCHRWLVRMVLPIPVLGSVFSNLAMSRMSMTLSMLLNSGVDAIQCAREAFLSTGNDYYIQGMPKSLAAIQKGKSLALSFEAAGVFPREFIDGIEVGELSGNETESLEALASEYSRRASSALTQLSVLTGVGIWIAIGLLIIFIIIRMVMQYVSMLNSLMP
jgi:type IV pilus assembly protein PilC